VELKNESALQQLVVASKNFRLSFFVFDDVSRCVSFQSKLSVYTSVQLYFPLLFKSYGKWLVFNLVLVLGLSAVEGRAGRVMVVAGLSSSSWVYEHHVGMGISFPPPSLSPVVASEGATAARSSKTCDFCSHRARSDTCFPSKQKASVSTQPGLCLSSHLVSPLSSDTCFRKRHTDTEAAPPDLRIFLCAHKV
jgi:hypothetical protein